MMFRGHPKIFRKRQRIDNGKLQQAEFKGPEEQKIAPNAERLSLRSQDSGKSLNPAVDIGQIEVPVCLCFIPVIYQQI